MLLSPLQQKCAEYWPNTDRTDTLRIYGDYEVLQRKREIKHECMISTLLLKNMEVIIF